MRLKLVSLPAAGLCLALVAASAIAASPPAAKPAATPALPGSAAYQPPPTRYDLAPEPWRSYLLKAREADAIKDPLQRCLAFPAIPGSKWPANLIPAHCHYTFGLDLTLDKIKQKLDANDAAGLEATFRALQDRHFSDSDFSELIHSALELFDGSYEAGVVSKRWLEAAPDSVFAMTARAEFYRHMGWNARGGQYVKDTPGEQFDRMHEYHAKAKALYEQALEKEPRLMPAYSGLVDLASNDNSDDAFKAGYKFDPACKVLLSTRMHALMPRWGGSYPQMFALEKAMLPYLDKRPLLALSRIWPYDDMRDVAYAAEKYPEAVAALEPMVAVSSSPQVFEDLASAIHSLKNGGDRWQELAYAVQASAFRPGDGWDARNRGRLQLTLAHDPELANRSLAAAVAAEPDDYYGHYLYASSFALLGKLDEAEREYLIALKDKPDTGNHRDALFALGELSLRAKRVEKTRAYAKQATTEYPDDPRAWRLNWFATGMEHVPLETLREAVQKFLAKVDPSDPRFQREIEDARKALLYFADFEKNGAKK